MTTEKVFAKSNAKDVLALSKASAEAMLANFTITIVLAGTKTDDEVTLNRPGFLGDSNL
ncbi:hypothetical protein [Pseudomonas savastanoi]|uniref:hypothetical protein n=1 Tax=Pseudomonas savastanoi TaxID=29438 RepID=UPI000AD04CC9|nr:hypothetical protein [Pseudomonas savastanoi]